MRKLFKVFFRMIRLLDEKRGDFQYEVRKIISEHLYAFRSLFGNPLYPLYADLERILIRHRSATPRDGDTECRFHRASIPSPSSPIPRESTALRLNTP